MGLGGADSLAFLVLLHAPVIGIVTIPDVVAAAFQQCPRAGRAQWRRRDGRSARIAARGPQFPLSALRPVPAQIRSDSIPCLVDVSSPPRSPSPPIPPPLPDMPRIIDTMFAIALFPPSPPRRRAAPDVHSHPAIHHPHRDVILWRGGWDGVEEEGG